MHLKNDFVVRRYALSDQEESVLEFISDGGQVAAVGHLALVLRLELRVRAVLTAESNQNCSVVK